MNDTVAGVARAVAGELVPRYAPRLVADVEAAIHADDGHKPLEQQAPGQYLDPTALGALIVAIAQFGYQVYTDRKSKGHKPTREAIAQAIRIERRRHSDLTGEETEIIDIISAKIIERGDDELPGIAGISRGQARRYLGAPLGKHAGAQQRRSGSGAACRAAQQPSRNHPPAHNRPRCGSASAAECCSYHCSHVGDANRGSILENCLQSS